VVRLAWVTFAGGVVIVALYVFGTQHSPSYTFGLFGQRGAHAVRLKSQIATGLLGLALVQLLLALWVYRRLPGLRGRATTGGSGAPQRRGGALPRHAAGGRALHVRL